MSLDGKVLIVIAAMICITILAVVAKMRTTCDGNVLAINRPDGTWMLCVPPEATNEQERAAKK